MKRILLAFLLVFMLLLTGSDYPYTVLAQGGCVLQQSTASQEISLGPFLDSGDGVTPETGLTIANTDIRVKKAGADWAAKNSGGGTAEEFGNYRATMDATDTSALGIMELSVQVAGALPVFKTCLVVATASYAVNVSGGVITAPTNFSSLSITAAGRVDVAAVGGTTQTANDLGSLFTIRKNVASQTMQFHFVATSNGTNRTGMSSAQITCRVSKDNAAFAVTNDTTEAEIGLGWYYIDLTQAETNANIILFQCTATASSQVDALVTPQH